MKNWISEKVCLVFVAAFILSGCEKIPILRTFSKMESRKQQEDKVDSLSLAQEAEVISAPSDDAMRALDATGGLDAWKKTATLQLDCVVTFYQPDGSFYLTGQHYEVLPWLNSIQISADEPQGKFIWLWSEGKFDVLQGAGQIDALSKAAPSCCFAEDILDIITAPVRFMDGSVEFSKSSAPVLIQGVWYYPINRKEKIFTGHISEAVFYQDRESSLVDMIRLACTCTGLARDRKVQYVRGYDYKKVEEDGPLVPDRIEIFESDARDLSQKRLVKIDCYAIKYTQ
jgi:hypothetical protein